jgi:hypothetical protein
MQYRKKPIVIEAFKYGYDDFPEWFIGSDYYVNTEHHWLVIKTLEGDMAASLGDYIIKGVKGELYPCKRDIFEETYEQV